MAESIKTLEQFYAENKDRKVVELKDGTFKLLPRETLKRFVPQYRDMYWYLDAFGRITNSINENTYEDRWLIHNNLVFKTPDEAKNYKEYLEILNDYQWRVTDQEWKSKQKKYFLYWNDDGSYGVSYRQTRIYTTRPFFVSYKDAVKFVEEAGIDNVLFYMFGVEKD